MSSVGKRQYARRLGPLTRQNILAHVSVARSGCWEWARSLTPGGYGQKTQHGVRRDAHVLVYELCHGSVPARMVVRHTCDNRKCVRPDHLIVGTQLENVGDAIARGRLAQGSERAFAKLSDDDVRSMRELHAAGGWTFRALADRFGVSPGIAHQIVKGQAWKHVA